MSNLSRFTVAEYKRLMLANWRRFWPGDNWLMIHYEIYLSDLTWLERVRILNLMSLYPETEQKIVDYLEDGVCIGDVFKLITGRDAYEVHCSDVCCVI